MFKRILVPIDGSSASTAGLEQAVQLAQDQNSKLRIIHIVDEAVLAEYPEMMGDNAADLINAMISDGRKTLAKAMQIASRHGIKADTVLYEKLLSSIPDLIMEEAKKWRADLIVMGTHIHHGTIKHFFNGGDAATLVRDSRVPVLLFHGGKPARRATHRKRRAHSAAPSQPAALH
jgi:nucleotide-binding universal stress UspA family protein